MSAHTPGPWRLVEWTAPDDYGWSIKIGDAPHRLEVSAWSASSEADAHLIAAAPELLEALERLADTTQGLDVTFRSAAEESTAEDALGQARAAIAKARGGK